MSHQGPPCNSGRRPSASASPFGLVGDRRSADVGATLVRSTKRLLKRLLPQPDGFEGRSSRNQLVRHKPAH